MAFIERFVTDAASGGDGNDNLGLSLVNATYAHTGGGVPREITSSGAFSGYTFVAGDLIFLENQAGFVDGLYEIEANPTNDTIQLVSDARLTIDSTAETVVGSMP